MAKAGLEMKLLTSEVDAQSERWAESDNEIMKRFHHVSAFSSVSQSFTVVCLQSEEHEQYGVLDVPVHSR